MDKIYNKIKNNDYKILVFNNNKLPEKIDIQEETFIFINYIYSKQYNILSNLELLDYVIIPNNINITFKDLNEFIEYQVYIKYNLKTEFIYLKKTENKLNNFENTQPIECEYCETDDEECEECNKNIKIENIKNKEIKIEEIKDENMENKEYTEKDLKKMKIKEISKICEEKGFKTDYKRLKKQEYIDCILNNKPLRQKKKSKEDKDLKTLLKLQ